MSTALPTRPVLHSEWIKIRSLRGTFGALIAVLVATAGIQTFTAWAIGTAEEGAMGDDPLFASYYAINFGQIAAIAFGANAFAAEFHNGALRTTFAAVPNRTRFYLSKMAVLGGLALLVGQVTALLTFVGGQAFMGQYALKLGDPGTVRSVVGCGLYLMVITLFSAGLTAILRSGVAVISILVPFVLLLSFVISGAAGAIGEFMPDKAGQMILRSESTGGVLGPWTGMGVAMVWAAAAIIGGLMAVRRRDA